MRYLTLAGYRTLNGGRLPRRQPMAEFKGDDRAAAETARDASITDTAAYDADPLSITLTVTGQRDPIYQVRRDGSWVDVDPEDAERVVAALDYASGEIRATLPEDLYDAEGEVLETVPNRLVDVLPGIAFDLARYTLTDGATGPEDAVTLRHRSARKLLASLKNVPDRPTVEAELLDGTSQWHPSRTGGEDDE